MTELTFVASQPTGRIVFAPSKEEKMTKLHTDGEELLLTDPFDGTQFERRIVITPTKEEKHPAGRALAAAFWASYFALHWLLLLEVIEPTWQRFGASLFFFVAALLLSVHIEVRGALKEKK